MPQGESAVNAAMEDESNAQKSKKKKNLKNVVKTEIK